MGKKAKLKKKVLGVKLPKDVRVKGALLLETASSPVGRELIASGIVALAGMAAAKKSPVAAAMAREGTANARKVADVVGDAAGALMQKLSR